MKAFTVGLLILCGAVNGAQAASWTGSASYYSGRGKTANGQHVGSLTCAHRSLPFGTRLKVTNLSNGHSTQVVVNDRGPFIGGRIIDVSVGAAGILGMRRAGVAKVRVERI